MVPIHDYGEIDGQMYLEMRLIEGTDLDNLLKRFGPLTPPRAVAIITQVASALDAAHAAGVMHRDVKPQNILVTREDFAYLVDFGIASATTDEKLTQLGTAVGTWKYMAPERFSNDEVTYRADIYALACVLHECLTGSPPYRADSASMLVTAHTMDPIPQPSTVRAGIPKAFDTVIARGMAKQPGDRYVSAGDLALAAHEALSNPDQDHAADILRRSQEATLPGPPDPAAPTTMPATAATPPSRPGPAATPPRPASTPQQPPYYPAAAAPAAGSPPSGPSAVAGPPRGVAPSGPAGPSGPIPRPPAAGQPGWQQASGPIPASQPTPSPPYYQGSGWGGAPPPGQPAGPSTWNQGPQGPGPRGRNPWPIVAAVAIVLVLIVGGIGVWTITQPPKPSPPPKPIAEDRLSSLLLSPAEVNSVMGASNIQPGKPITSMDASPVTLSLPECQGALYTSQDPVYSGTGYTAISGLVASEPGDNNDHWVNQAVVSFPSAAKASSFVETMAGKWKNCAGKTVTVTNKSKTYRWTFAQVVGSPPRITMLETQEGAEGWECQRVMSVANNVIVDINSCGYHITDQGGALADKIVDKIHKETKY